MRYTAEVINLSGTPMIRVKRSWALVGYYLTPAAMIRDGIDLAEVEIR